MPPQPPAAPRADFEGQEAGSTSSTFSTDPHVQQSLIPEPIHADDGNDEPGRIDSSTSSTNSTGVRVHNAIIPDNTILSDYLDFARAQEESADCYLVGAILPIVAGILARNVFFPFGKDIFPNLYAILVGKPGDRKSSAIDLAEKIGRRILPSQRFLSAVGSAEAYFDEYDPKVGGNPDKILVCDDANPLLSTWMNTSYGENAATRFLNLYDCKGLTETFKRNLKNKPADPTQDPSATRNIPETSTNIVLGATFNGATFHGQQIRAGLQRRFLYYVAERHGRLIIRPEAGSADRLMKIENLFRKLASFGKVRCDFTSDADDLWGDIQRTVRRHSAEIKGVSETQEALLARINSQPVQILKVAMVFQACRAAKTAAVWDGLIEEDILAAARDHVALCIESAGYLDTIGQRAEIHEKATIILNRIQHDFKVKAENGYILITKSELTAKFCHHDRQGALSTSTLYGQIIPELIRQRLVTEEPKEGKLQRYRVLSES